MCVLDQDRWSKFDGPGPAFVTRHAVLSIRIVNTVASGNAKRLTARQHTKATLGL
jgi:hypothetical protein